MAKILKKGSTRANATTTSWLCCWNIVKSSSIVWRWTRHTISLFVLSACELANISWELVVLQHLCFCFPNSLAPHQGFRNGRVTLFVFSQVAWKMLLYVSDERHWAEYQQPKLRKGQKNLTSNQMTTQLWGGRERRAGNLGGVGGGGSNSFYPRRQQHLDCVSSLCVSVSVCVNLNRVCV